MRAGVLRGIREGFPSIAMDNLEIQFQDMELLKVVFYGAYTLCKSQLFTTILGKSVFFPDIFHGKKTVAKEDVGRRS